ncbi:MAG: gamma-glutamyl-gamma-aminobutyrate hydrolase family protein [Solirubrobacteraceae bacterium]
MQRPLIGVSTSEVRVAERVLQTPEGEPPIDREMALGMKYLWAIEAAGGIPVVMPPLELEAVEPLLDRLSGICLSGGPDLDPETYRAKRRNPHLGPTEPDLDRFELAVAREADRRALPILAICRGMQAINVARGGTLYQHLPDRAGTECQHRQSGAGERVTHSVEVEPATKLARVLGKRRILRVNSFHHQSVRRLGSGLRAVAWAPDGVVEGIEAPGRPFLLGVQWHAECLVARRPQMALFEAFVHAARGHGVALEGQRAA